MQKENKWWIIFLLNEKKNYFILEKNSINYDIKLYLVS